MYRIRLASGREHVYASIQELTAGVQSGEVTAEAQIYHQRTDRWLGIDTHPHYRMVVDGATATRPNRLRFTRPSQPVATPVVRPTPAAHEPAKGDLEELNRLLVLLDPLPAPAPRIEPPASAAASAPAPEPLRSESAPPPADPADFGTMLRLEDLDTLPPVPPPAPTLDVLRDERVMAAELPPVDEAPAAPAAPAPEAPPAASDLGLPVEVHLDEIPVPALLEPPSAFEPLASDLAVVEPSIVEMPAQPIVEAAPESPVAESAIDDEPVAAPPAVTLSAVQVEPGVIEVVATDAAGLHAPRRRARPMLFLATAAIIALVIFAFTSRGNTPNQGIVTPASATSTNPPPSGAAPAETSTQAPAQPIGFPLPSAEQAKAAQAKAEAENQPPVDATPAAPVLPSAPSIDLGATGAEVVDAGVAGPRGGKGNGAALARGYAASYATLGAEFNAQMDRSGLVRLFGQTQLTTPDGIAGARRALDAAADAVRQYHTGEGIIERAYQDSARALERSGASAADLRDWITHVSLRESQEAAGEGARLIGQIDAVFALLQGQLGRYRVDGATIRFDDRNAAARYSDLQGWINRRLEHWSGQPASSVPTSVQPILEGIGLTRLPTSR